MLLAAGCAARSAVVEIKIDPGFKAEVEVESKFGEEASETGWTETVLEVKDGAAVKLEQAFSKHRRNGRPTSLEGQTVVFSDSGGPRCRIDAPPSVDSGDLRDLGLRAEALRRSIPREPIAVGREWDVDEREATADVNDNGSGHVCVSARLRCALVRLDGGVAVVRMAGELRSKEGRITTVESYYFISLEKKYVIGVESNGTVGGVEFSSQVRSRAK